MKKYLYVIPSLLLVIYLSFISVYLLNDFNMNSVLVIVLTILFLIPLIIYITQLISCIKDAIKNKKYIYLVLLIFFGLFFVPYYGSKFFLKRIILKNTIITYIIAFVFFSIITIIYSLTLLGKNTNMELLTKDSKVEFTVTSDWKKKNYDGYSLYAANETDKLAFGLLTYNLSEYEDFTETNILESQIGFLKTKVDTLILKSELTEKKYPDKVIKTIEYVGTIKKEKKLYKLSTITFKDNKDYVVYVFEAMLEKDYNKNNKTLIEILESAKLK